MADLPAGFVAPTRDEWREMFLRRYKVRAPQLDASERSPVYLDACAAADLLNVVGANCTRIALSLDLANADESTLTTEANAMGIELRRAATSSSGAVTISASTGGGLLAAGDELTDRATGIKFSVVFSGSYSDGQSCAIVSVDKGPRANLAAGTVLYWAVQRPGIGPSAVVAAQTDGSGLSGGRLEETVEEFRARLIDAKRNPPAGSNEASLRALLESPALGFGIQKAFSFPNLLGPGTCGLTILVPPAITGGARIPSVAQLAKAYSILPGNDNEFVLSPLAQATTVKLRVRWGSASLGWVDARPWPSYSASYPVTVTSGVPATATTFELTAVGAPSPTAPTAGQTIAFWDPTTATFRRKRIASFTGTNPWTITVDVTNSASDTAFVPPVGALACPYAAGLDEVGAVVAAHFDGLGPGEAVTYAATDEGQRQRRHPFTDEAWPSSLSTRAFVGIDDLESVRDWQIAEPSLPHTPANGTTSWVYVLQLTKLAIHPL